NSPCTVFRLSEVKFFIAYSCLALQTSIRFAIMQACFFQHKYGTDTMAEYRTFTTDDAMRFADEHSGLFGDHSKLSCEEFGDGNLNLVFRVSNDKGTSL